jgi:hypothetical protein
MQHRQVVRWSDLLFGWSANDAQAGVHRGYFIHRRHDTLHYGG